MAQLVAQLICNQWVGSSSLSIGTIFIRVTKMKEKLEIIESVLSIIVSLIAIYGTIVSVYSGFWKNIHNWFMNNL